MPRRLALFAHKGRTGAAVCGGRTPREVLALAAKMKTALVTGAGSGIGRSIATTLAEMGLRVALLGRDREKLERVRADFVKGQDSAFIASCDISDRAAVESVVAEIDAALGPIDVLVCNAGMNVKNRSPIGDFRPRGLGIG